MESLTNIWLEISILLMLSVAAHYFVTRFGQPLIISEILIGIIIGPSLLGLITNTDSIAIFAEIGILVLLFAVGLECDLREVYSRRSIIVALWGVVLPWVGGFLFGLFVMRETTSTSIFLGAALTATSVAATSGVLLEFGLLDKTVGKTIMGAAVVDDILAMGALSISTGMAIGGPQVSNLLLLFLTTCLFIIIGGFLGARYMPRLVNLIEAKTTKVKHSGFLFALSMMFLYVVIANLIGVSSIIGAFIAGTIFPVKTVKEEFRTGTEFLASVFTPIFFISIGIIVNLPQVLISYWYLILALLLTLVAIITKVIGCGIAAKLFKMNTNDSLIVGFGMVPRCEVALAIALFGLSTGIITQSLYSIVVLMAIFTTIFIPSVLSRLMARSHKVRARPKKLRKKEIVESILRKE